MTDTLDKIAPKNTAGYAQSPGRRRWAAHALGVVLLALIVAGGEVKLIEQAAATGSSCGIAGHDGLVRIVDNGLTSGFAPIANLR
jgi:hypothetical protein